MPYLSEIRDPQIRFLCRWLERVRVHSQGNVESFYEFPNLAQATTRMRTPFIEEPQIADVIQRVHALDVAKKFYDPMLETATKTALEFLKERISLLAAESQSTPSESPPL
jgi:hypothetical protein